MARVITPLLIAIPTVLAFIAILPNSWWQEYEYEAGADKYETKHSIWRYESDLNGTAHKKGDVFGNDDDTMCGDSLKDDTDCCPYYESVAGLMVATIVLSAFASLATCFSSPTGTRILAGASLFLGFIFTTAACALWYDKMEDAVCGKSVKDGLKHHDLHDYQMGFWSAMISAIVYLVFFIVFVVFRKQLAPMTPPGGNSAQASTNMGSLLF